MSALALDRHAIEKTDFPVSRRGFDPSAVRAHLGALAGEVEALQRRLEEAERAPAAPAPAEGASLADAASGRVRLIVEAAERSAAEIDRAAREEASRVRADADAEARATRDDAVARAQDHIGGVAKAATAMLKRVDAMEGELGALVDSLRTGSNRLTADLSLLQGDLGELYDAAGGVPAPAPVAAAAPPPPEPPVERAAAAAPVEPAPSPAPEAPAEPAPATSLSPPAPPVPRPARSAPRRGRSRREAAAAPANEAPPAAAAPPPGAAAAAPAPTPASAAGDVDGARLVALNMALNGQSRQETDAYLRDSFALADRAALLDEVYATVEG